jgi:hypothetical protein
MLLCAVAPVRRADPQGSPPVGSQKTPLVPQHDEPVAESVRLDQPQRDLRVRMD